jgi:PAS domain S-box-containing protein
LLDENINQEIFYEDIINNIPVAIALVRMPDCQIVVANTEFKELSNAKQDLTGAPLGSVWSELIDVFEDHLNKIKNNAEVIHLENVPLLKRNSERIYCNSTFVPIFTDIKNVLFVLITLQNTTDSFLKNKENSDQLLRDKTLLSSMVDGVMIHALDGSITYMNPGAKILHDIADGINNTISFEFFDDNHRQIPLQEWPYSRALRGKRFTGYEVTVLNKHTGREWYASYNGSPVYDNDGKMLFAVISVLDITERRKAQIQLQYANLKFQKLIESNIVGIVITNENGDLIEVNDYYLNLIGYTREDVEKKKIKWNEITPSESLQKDYDAIRKLRTKGEADPYEKQYIRKDGSRVWVLIGLINFIDNQILGYIIDITTNKKSEEALRKSELQLRTVFNSVSDGIIIFSSSGKAVLINKALRLIKRSALATKLSRKVSLWSATYFMPNSTPDCW